MPNRNIASVDFGGAITDGFSTLAAFVPKLIGFVLILIVGYFIAKIIAKIVDRILEHVGFDQAVEKGGIKKALSRSTHDASDIVARIVFFAIFIPVLSAAISTLGIAALSAPLAAFIALIPKILVAIILVVLGAALAGAARKLITASLGGLSFGKLLATGASVLSLLGFVKAALDEVGIATTVTRAVLIFVLATLGGVLVVGVGGGLIKPMQSRMEQALTTASDEAGNVKQRMPPREQNSGSAAPSPIAAPVRVS